MEDLVFLEKFKLFELSGYGVVGVFYFLRLI